MGAFLTKSKFFGVSNFLNNALEHSTAEHLQPTLLLGEDPSPVFDFGFQVLGFGV